MLESMPIKVKAHHLLSGSEAGVMSLILPVLKHLFTKELRMKLVVHSGTEKRILGSLSPYGLIAKNLPHLIGGGFKREDSFRWCEKRKEEEEMRFVAKQQQQREYN